MELSGPALVPVVPMLTGIMFSELSGGLERPVARDLKNVLEPISCSRSRTWRIREPEKCSWTDIRSSSGQESSPTTR